MRFDLLSLVLVMQEHFLYVVFDGKCPRQFIVYRPYLSCEVLGACVFIVVGGSLCVDGLVGSVMMGESEGACAGSPGF